jgi:hypothetical protein
MKRRQIDLDENPEGTVIDVQTTISSFAQNLTLALVIMIGGLA